MNTKIATNGFGRIGRGILPALIEQGCPDVDVVTINDLAPAETIAHLLKYGPVHGRPKETVMGDGDMLIVGARRIRLTAIRPREDLPWPPQRMVRRGQLGHTEKSECVRSMGRYRIAGA